MQRPFLQCSEEQGRNHDADVCYKLGYGLHGQFKMLITNFSFGILRSRRFTRSTRYTNVKEQAEAYKDMIGASIKKILAVFSINEAKWPYIHHLKKVGLRPKLSKSFLWLSKKIEGLSALFVLCLVFLTLEQVIARYWFQASSIAIQELQWHLFGLIFLLAGVATLQHDEHVRVDIFYSRWSEKRQKLVNALGLVFFLIPVCLVLIAFGIADVREARHYSSTMSFGSESGVQAVRAFETSKTFIVETILKGESSPNPGGLPGRWIIKSMLPIGAALLLFQGLMQLLTILFYHS